jgi:hypothetical protein
MTPEQRRLRDALATTPDRAAAAGRDSVVPPTEAPAPDAWSAREVLLHLAAVEEKVWHARLTALANEASPRWPWTEPDLWSGPGDDTYEGALAAFTTRRGVTVARLDALDADGWARRGLHEVFGVLDVAALLRIALDHDEEHLAQIGRE